MQNLVPANWNLASWMNAPGPLGCVVTAVYDDENGQQRVDVTLTRYGLPLRMLFPQTPCPSVGDVGFVTFVDQHRDIPVFVGVRSAAVPLMSATVQSVSTSSVTVTLTATGAVLTGVPFVGTAPQVGARGVVGFLDSRSNSPVYLGSLGG
jgi:hypothetical protein